MNHHKEIIDAYFLALGIKKKIAKTAFESEKSHLDFDHFIENFQNEGIENGINFIQNDITNLKEFLNFEYPILVFKPVDDTFHGEILNPKTFSDIDPEKYCKNGNKLLYFIGYPIENLQEKDEIEKKYTPFQRTFRMLYNERKDIYFIYLYAFVAGIINLSLPLGIQSIIGFISSGRMFSSVYVLIGVVLIGILISGFILVTQSTLVEVIQRRIFVKAAIEYTHRTPRLKMESLLGNYAPEIMNRFFDIVTIQKSLPKLLIDFSGALLQIIFGIILLCLYHPYFIIFGLIVSLLLYFSIKINAPVGLNTSLNESKYKYKIAQWLQEIARTIHSFKLSGETSFPIEKMNGLINNYLLYREKHYQVLKKLYYYLIFFKIFTIGGLLILGSFLVINQQINLGQFVASEIIIVLIIGSVEKLITGIDSIFDMITGVEKISVVAEIPMDKKSGFELEEKSGIDLSTKNLTYAYPNSTIKILNNVNFKAKSNDFIAITGANSSGKETLMKILAGIYFDYEGIVEVNNFSLKSLTTSSYHNLIEKNFEFDDIFDGTILENITMGRKNISLDAVHSILSILDIKDTINATGEGLNTQMISGGKKFAGSFLNKISLARILVSKPKVLLLTDNFYQIAIDEKIRIMDYILDKQHKWTVIISTFDENIIQKVDKVFILENGVLSQTK